MSAVAVRKASSIRGLCVGSFNAARVRANADAIPMTAASAAGFALAMTGGDGRLALERLTGDDDWAVRARTYLWAIVEGEESP